jgi:hypothetical protein
MRETPSGEGTALDATSNEVRLVDAVPFKITAFQRVSYGSKSGEFDVVTSVGVIECDLFEPQGRAAFIQARSVRNKYDGSWKRTVRLAPDFARRVLEALDAQSAEAPKPEPERKGNQVLLASEAAFDRALDEFGEAGAA